MTENARTFTDVAETDAERKWARGILDMAARVMGMAAERGATYDEAIAFVCAGISLSAVEFQPRAELFEQVLWDLRWAITAPDDETLN